ncbi:uncharacterized protein BXIN_0696 [Babesia sp. Xinjiang]|uniref:uncharacterized protein n=1 Tax=Babesia sp. Xinjiang TaxID=462227 RepID=UPI000A24D786|nr:uncharacterized protein BXIN_0703 [Babesia sp. Xinjiang]XP_028872608.1 uncharacterized protein BXIN_0696 [Babesia sp. Xinjiang]ORM42129.1 hypothetical protein BXIN_0703 [Babesia sp. Xinjiang]ORM42152.1 hypothetical protein BXIN_0696 [Babesia sp. Xinjiang]
MRYFSDYIGLGYDAIFGNPFGSFGQNNDAGYRNPIVETSVSIGDKQPHDQSPNNQSWTREIATCWLSDTREDVGDEDLLHDLQNEFQVEGPESNEILEANIRSESNGDSNSIYTKKYRIAKSFCAIKESGIVLPYKGTISSVFLKDVENLPKEIANLGTCTPDVYIAEPTHEDCADIHMWMKFFKRYGTHITTRLVIGGQIIYIDRVVTAEKSTNTQHKKVEGDKNVSVVDDFRAMMNGTRESHQMWVIGGFYFTGLEHNDSRAFNKWLQSVWKRPMPIRANFSSLDHFLGEKGDSYHHALSFYRNFQNVANGHSLNYRTFSQMLKEMVMVVADNGFARCPSDMVVVAGFVITKSIPISIDTCIPSSDVIRDDAIAVALCAKGTGFTLTAIESKNSRSCPGDLVVAFGFQLFVDQSSALQLTACPSGRRDCGSMPSRDGVEWKACIQRSLLDSSFSPRSGAILHRQYKTLGCPDSQKVVSGFSLRRIENKLVVDKCLPGIKTCSIRCGSEKCRDGAAYMLCL